MSPEKREKFLNASRKFFALSLQERNKIMKDDKNVFGYNDAEHTKNVGPERAV